MGSREMALGEMRDSQVDGAIGRADKGLVDIGEIFPN